MRSNSTPARRRFFPTLIITSIALVMCSPAAGHAQGEVFNSYYKVAETLRSGQQLMWTCDALGQPSKTPTPVPPFTQLTSKKALVSADPQDASRLRVYLFEDLTPAVLQAVAVPSYKVAAVAAPSPMKRTYQELLSCEMFYNVVSEKKAEFPVRGWAVSGLAVPVRVRSQVVKRNAKGERIRIEAEIASALTGGFLFGYRWEERQYAVARNKAGAWSDAWKVNLAGALTLGNGTLDSKSTRAADTPLDNNAAPAGFPTVSVGPAVTFRWRGGVEIGVISGIEFAAFPRARRLWDRNAGLWYGVGLGYQVWR